MNKAKNIQNKKLLLTVSIVIVVALALIASPIVAMNDAFATKKKNGNTATQSIFQSQSSEQNSLVVSGGDTMGSGNNINVQNQKNTGNNALPQGYVSFPSDTVELI